MRAFRTQPADREERIMTIGKVSRSGIAPRIREDAHAALDSHCHGGGEAQHVDDNRDIGFRRRGADRPPLESYGEAGLPERLMCRILLRLL